MLPPPPAPPFALKTRGGGNLIAQPRLQLRFSATTLLLHASPLTLPSICGAGDLTAQRLASGRAARQQPLGCIREAHRQGDAAQGAAGAVSAGKEQGELAWHVLS